jgi:hypothetical protein
VRAVHGTYLLNSAHHEEVHIEEFVNKSPKKYIKVTITLRMVISISNSSSNCQPSLSSSCIMSTFHGHALII